MLNVDKAIGMPAKNKISVRNKSPVDCPETSWADYEQFYIIVDICPHRSLKAAHLSDIMFED